MTDGRGLRILVIEDEVLVALELECLLEEGGHAVVGTAVESREAMSLGERLRPDLALIDIHLADGPTGLSVAQALDALGDVTVLFTTANAKRIPDAFSAGLGIVAKPYSPRAILAAVEYVARVRAGQAPERVPEGMRLIAR